MVPYEALNGLQNANIPYGTNYHLNGVTRAPTVTGAVAEKVFNAMIASANKPSAVGGITPTIAVLWEFYPLKKQSSVAPEAMAFRMRVPLPVSTMFITWEGEGEDPTAVAAITKEMKERLSSFKTFAKETFTGGQEFKNDTGYSNNGMSWFSLLLYLALCDLRWNETNG
jgi:hypothetical protein